MAHEIEHRADRSTDSFAFVGERNEIWHRLGQQAGADWTSEQWRQASNQDFEVAKVPLHAVASSEGPSLKIDSHAALLRTDTGAVLSIVSAEWEPAQNHHAYEFLEPLIKAGFGTINTAGVLYEGRRVFVLLKTKDGFQLPGGDDNEGYVLVQISHEYGIADLVLPTAVRVVCKNTLQFALQGKSKAQIDAGKFVHRAKTSFSVEKANALIEAYRLGLGEYAEKARFLTTKRATPEQTRAYVNKVFKLQELKDGSADEIARRKEANEKTVQTLIRLVDTQPGANLSPGTWWSNVNAVTFYEDHGRYQGREQEPVKFDGVGADRKRAAFKLALELAA